MSRSINAIRNIFFGLINNVVIMLFPFIIRTIIINKLGTEYLGLSSLFTSILQVLNLAELGISSAIVFSMYKPIAQGNKETICALMNLYRTVYRIIGIIILTIGLIITPFITFLIKGSYPQDINIYIIYIIYILNTSLTYFLFAYKSTLLIANQRNDIVSNINTIVNIIQFIFQIIVLVMFKNYYLYIIMMIIGTIINNIIVAIIVRRKYPEYKPNGSVDKKTISEIKQKVKGLVIQRICSTTRNSIDSIFISAFIGLSTVAIYTNYYYILSALVSILGIVTASITSGVGNSIVTETVDKNYNDMIKFNFMHMWISGWCTVCLFCLYQPFMKIWMGEKYMLDIYMVALFCIYFYSLKMGVIRGIYSDAKGLWYENRYRAIIESITNVILNFLFVKLLGIYGIIIGTNISLIVINFVFGSQILFKHYFKNKTAKEFFLHHSFYIIVTFINVAITYSITNLINIKGLLGLIIMMIICIIVPNIIYYLAYRKTDVYQAAKKFIYNILIQFKKNKINRGVL